MRHCLKGKGLISFLLPVLSTILFEAYAQLNKTIYVKPFCNFPCRNIYSIICEEKTVKNWKSLIRWFSLLQKPFPTTQYQHSTFHQPKQQKTFFLPVHNLIMRWMSRFMSPIKSFVVVAMRRKLANIPL